ncbi:MAG: glycosyltransferase family 4 protein [Bacteroidales bacterium]|nr:glycosyltransferase family 4 protein [Bacteroidales bacterium]
MDTTLQRNIVISAVNLRKGGTLTVLRNCLQYLSGREDLHVTALVHDRGLCDFPGIDYIEIPWSVRSWAHRLWCEYVTMRRISARLPKTDLWLSLHDTTPNVKALRQAVYCHTAFPFMTPTLQDLRMDFKIVLFSRLTRFAYRINVRRNRYLIVQQDWMRRKMSKLLGFPAGRIIVAPPSFRPLPLGEGDSRSEPGMTKGAPGMTVFLYPATADAHKNFETLCEAARILEHRVGKGTFLVKLTISGDENTYAAYLRHKWADVDSICFNGLMSREALGKAVAGAAALVFPSRAETWGLPITEFLPTGKPMLLANLPYAYETAAGAQLAAFFPVADAVRLADLMQEVMARSLTSFGPVPGRKYNEPYAANWKELFALLLK